MLTVTKPGPTRRTALKAGALGALGFTAADFLKLKAAGAVKKGASDKSVILIWLDGGPSQFETYDPKPNAPSEYRGPFGDIRTNVPGIRFSDMLPLQAKHADKMAVIRSCAHTTGDHFAAAHWMLTGRFGSTSVDKAQKSPSIGSCVAKLAGPKAKGLPPYIGLPAAESVYLYPGYQGAAYLGGEYEPFQVNMKQKYLAANSKVEIKPPPFLDGLESAQDRISGRASLLQKLDGLNREIDHTGSMENMDIHQQNAIEMVLGSNAREAFDMEKEDPKLRDSYGRGPWGHYTLMARRLVENGVRFVTVDMPHWDNHSKIKTAMETRLPVLDLAVSGLMQDLSDRGLLDETLVVIMGEFGRTPKLNQGQPGIPIPGRDHWGQSMSVIMAGGGIKGGQVVGATNKLGEHPIERPLTPADVLATIYHVLGIEWKSVFLPDFTGRPIPLLDGGSVIDEIV
ncbi:MAG: DUF1501 domain-containing protein [Verrucomicrobiales bacterium]|nr:DUF1501 domain-containing protein [Verrucomicrobiales bacterium]